MNCLLLTCLDRVLNMRWSLIRWSLKRGTTVQDTEWLGVTNTDDFAAMIAQKCQ